MNYLRKNKAITLIALVITIVVMLILVAVTITMAVNGKLFDYTGSATRDTEASKQNELKIGEGQITVDNKTYSSVDEYFKAESFSSIYKETKPYKENGVITAWIPKGFAVGTSEGINKVEDGLVIQDKNGNQYVWIPVNYTKTNLDENNNELDDGFENVFYRLYWNNRSGTVTRLTSTSMYEEPKSNAADWEKEDYKNMMKQVQKYSGFYIGRFEAGIPTTENPRYNVYANYGTNTMVVQRDCFPYNEVALALSRDNYEDDIIITSGENTYNYGKGAIYLCKKKYEGNDYGVECTVCYAIQWDRIMVLIRNKKNVFNSKDWGNHYDSTWIVDRPTAQFCRNAKQWYHIEEGGQIQKSSQQSILLTTGASDNFKVMNIYDLAGNLQEKTMESYSNYIMHRGGQLSYNSSDDSASTRGYSAKINGLGYNSGFRPALYIK